MKKLIIAGGTGFIGQALIAYFENKFDRIVVLSRAAKKETGKTSYLPWDAKTLGAWCVELEGATCIINLSGKNMNCRFTKKNKAEILASRIDSTKIIGEAIAQCANPPSLWINGSAVGIYRDSEQTPMTERAGEIGHGFFADVCQAWEKAFHAFAFKNTRMAVLRISMVLGKSGGVLPVMTRLTKMGLGGTLGNGRQLMSWVHINDLCGMVDWILSTPSAKGAYNAVAPEPISNKNMMKLFRQKTKMPVGLPAPKILLEIGAFFMRTETELVLKSTYAVPERFLEEGFVFKYGDINACLDSFALA